MLTKLKESILQKKFEKTLVKYVQERKTSNKKIISVGILTTDKITKEFNLQKDVENFLNVKNTKIYSFKDFNKLDEVSYKHFSKKDINWNGKYTQQNFQSFLEEPFDLLIGYFKINNLYLETAVLQSKATFKTGFSSVNSELYEIEILGEYLNSNKFLTELKKYLQILKKLKS